MEFRRDGRWSSEGTEDEAEIRAALERLPTYDSMRTTTDLERSHSANKSRRDKVSVPVKDIDLVDFLSKQVFKFNNPLEGNDIFLTRLRERFDKSQILVLGLLTMVLYFCGFLVFHPQFDWTNPAAYHIYGILVSQFGDLNDINSTSQIGETLSVKELIRKQYGYNHNFLWFVSTLSVAFPILLAFLFVVSIKYLSYQQRYRRR